MAAVDYFSDPVNYPLLANSGSNLVSQSVDAISALILGLYPSLGCSALVDAVDAINNAPSAVYANGIYLTPTDLSFIAPGVIANVAAEFLQLYVNNVLIAQYNWTWNLDGTKSSISTIINQSTFTLNGPDLSMIIGASGTGNSQIVTMPFLTYSHVDAQGLVGFLIPQCAIAPTALPSSPGAIKSANFTRIFNPLNLPLRSK